jgi:hypothetical protein
MTVAQRVSSPFTAIVHLAECVASNAVLAFTREARGAVYMVKLIFFAILSKFLVLSHPTRVSRILEVVWKLLARDRPYEEL